MLATCHTLIVKNLWRKAKRVSSPISPFVSSLSPLSFKLGMLSICLTFAPPHSSFYGSSLFEFQTDLSAETTHRLGVGSCRPFFLKILPQNPFERITSPIVCATLWCLFDNSKIDRIRSKLNKSFVYYFLDIKNEKLSVLYIIYKYN